MAPPSGDEWNASERKLSICSEFTPRSSDQVRFPFSVAGSQWPQVVGFPVTSTSVNP